MEDRTSGSPRLSIRLCVRCRAGHHTFDHGEMGCMAVVWIPYRGAVAKENDFICQCLVAGRNVEKRKAFGKNRLMTNRW